MEQQELIQLTANVKLDIAAGAVDVLNSNNKKHAYFGGYAVSLFGGSRTTKVRQFLPSTSSYPQIPQQSHIFVIGPRRTRG
jgi:hypothetical protein